jgi:predicted transcriptional regulator of viral defense system
MLRSSFFRVHEIAMDQHGYFTVAQAREAGVGRQAVVMMERRGTIERVSYGLYKDHLVPTSPWGPYMAAVLWPHGTRGVLSHQSALELLGLSDVNPAKIHITLPRGFRVRRQVPNQYELHHSDLGPQDTTVVEGIPVTTAARTIRDCHKTHLGPDLLRQAIEDGRRTGWLQSAEARLVAAEVLPEGIEVNHE